MTGGGDRFQMQVPRHACQLRLAALAAPTRKVLPMTTTDWPSLALMAGALVAAGFLSGLLAGLLGIGGGAVVVVTLYEAFRLLGIDEAVRMHLATGTGLAIIAPTTLRSFLAHKRRGIADLDFLRRMAVPVVMGVGLGALVARSSGGDTLKWVWVLVGTFLAVKMYAGRDDWRLGPDIPKGLAVEVYGVSLGLVSMLMSVGGGAWVVMLMTFYGRSIHQAVATSSGFGPLIAIPGVLGFIWAGWGAEGLPPGSIGYVSLVGAALAIPTGLVAAPLGARLSHGLSKRGLELAFAIFMTCVVLRFLASLAL
ncbi:MAG: sulfite exporter TauE/SafE family protein [Hyphomicrobiaceae bacterium]|nr:sulfite exporter TauE/SafE family protein [Hyphomicrobiaceae bacterium]